jgi:hypothetical protein
MANAPKARKLTVDSSQDADQQLQQLIAQLNSFMADTHALFDGGLTQANLHQQQATLTVNTNGSGGLASPVEFVCTLSSRPSRVSHGQVKTISGSAPTAAVDVTQWTLKAGNTVSFAAIPGLAASSRYEIVVFVD